MTEIYENTLDFLVRHYEILVARNSANQETEWTLRALIELKNLREEIKSGELYR